MVQRPLDHSKLVMRWVRGCQPGAFCFGCAINFSQHPLGTLPPSIPTGDCNYRMEVMRGNFSLQKQHQVCVRRRAELSVGMNPHCRGPGEAAAAVDAVFDRCFRDTAPFDRRP